MERKIFLTVIIPVYNIKSYLGKCLQTVLCCNLKDCEIILTLGKSNDGSDKICQDYACRYSQIHIIQQNGTGLSNARNCALNIAKGEYVLFLDGDDYVDSNCLDWLIAQLRNKFFESDLVVTDFRRLEYPACNMRDIFQIGEGTPIQHGIDFLPQMLRKRQCFWNVWRYIFRLSFLKENHIRFLENHVSEDVDFVTRVFLAEPDVIFSHSPYYVYVVGRGGSLMDSLSKKRLQDTVYVLKSTVERLRISKFRYAPQLIAQYQYEYLLNIALVAEIAPEDRRCALELFEDWQHVFAKSPDPVIRQAERIIKILGIWKTSRCLHWMKMLRRWWLRSFPKARIKR